MNLSFDSINDLQEFLHWADKYRAVDLTVNRTREPLTGAAQWPKIDTGDVAFDTPDTPYPTIDTACVAFDTPPDARMPHPVTGDSSGAALEPAGKVPEQPATRKRRTKAEIEADKAAVAAAGDVALVGLQSAALGAQEPAGAAQQPDGTNPFEQVAEAAAAAGAASAADDAAAPDESVGDAVVTPFQHLTRAREFIAKHGMPKYNESFTKAGLDANVMGYSAYQRGLHMDALDALDKA